MTRKPPSGEPFEGVIGRTFYEFHALVAAGQVQDRRAQRGAGGAGRHRLFPPRLLRLDHRDAEHRRPGRRRPALHRLPHHRAVFADPGQPAHRPQPPCRRDAGDLQLRHRLSEHARGHSALGGDRGRDPARQRLRHLRRRQVAPGPDGRMHGRRPVHQLAAAEGLRPLLRLPAGRDRPVLPGTDQRQPFRRPARRTGRRLSRLRGHRRPLGRHDPRPEVAGAGAAVLPLPGLRGDALAAPGAAAPIWTSTAAGSTPAGTWPARSGSRARRPWASFRRKPSSRRATPG